LKIPDHLRLLAKQARAEGWTIEVTGKGHLRWTSPRGQAVMTGSTPQRHGHAPRIERHKLTRAGLGAKG
jgi:hypothetical protein